MGKAIEAIMVWLTRFFGWEEAPADPLEAPKLPSESVPLPITISTTNVPEPVKIEVMENSYLTTILPWTSVTNNKHNVRVICDQEGLTLEQKNTLCATVGGESGWQSYYLSGPKKGQPVKLDNKDEAGNVWSTDYGICQVNTHFWIGQGKEFPSVQYVLDNPEACIRWMAKLWKKGETYRNWWIAYKSGLYKQYL